MGLGNKYFKGLHPAFSYLENPTRMVKQWFILRPDWTFWDDIYIFDKKRFTDDAPLYLQIREITKRFTTEEKANPYTDIHFSSWRRLANQSLIDRLMKESVRCEQSSVMSLSLYRVRYLLL